MSLNLIHKVFKAILSYSDKFISGIKFLIKKLNLIANKFIGYFIFVIIRFIYSDYINKK